MKKIKKYDFACKACGFELLNQDAKGEFIRCNCEEFNFVDITPDYYRTNCLDNPSVTLAIYLEDGSLAKKQLHENATKK